MKKVFYCIFTKKNKKGMFSISLPKWLTKINEKIQNKYNIFPKKPNHVLINEYKPNQGIMVILLKSNKGT
jgi:hypothetical protein